MKSPFACSAAIVFLLMQSACSDMQPGASTKSSAVIRDSAGVQLVHTADSAIDTTSVELIEVSRIGVIDGDENLQFDRITGIATDDQGRFFVIDQGTQSVRVFGADGRYVRRFGKRGNGPGEFTLIRGLFRWRDTIHVADMQRHRASLFDTTGVLLASLTTLLPNGSRLLPLSGSPAGWLLTDDSLFATKQGYALGVARPLLSTIVRLDPKLLAAATKSRGAADSLTTRVLLETGARSFGTLGSEDGKTMMVLGNTPFFEPHASRTVDGLGRIYFAKGWPYRIDVRDADGKRIRRISRAHDSVAVTAELKAEVLRRAKSHYDTVTRQVGATWNTYRRRAELPEVGFLPVTSTLLVSPDGWLWVRRVDLVSDAATLEWSMAVPPQPSYWDVFRPDGQFETMVRLPPRFLASQAVTDGVIGVLRDELDVQYVVRYRLSKRQ